MPTKSPTRKEPKPGAKHPKYRSMVMTVINSKISRNGVSLRAILNYIHSTFEVSSSSKFVNTQVMKALANMVEDCVAILVTGTIGTGYFKLKSSQKSKSKSNANLLLKRNQEKLVKQILRIERKPKELFHLKENLSYPKNLKRASLLYKRKSDSKDSTKKSSSKNSKAKSHDKVPEKSVKNPNNIQKKPPPQVEPKSPKVKKE
ncbi:histone H1.4-like [Octopus sinensis]|uniref:Histone H1.4-like n=1 Tax=Octopus sinensis TaxID=2607531 RepID=A0A6P7S9N2_9MOLL|nr:histone H1.4-like [Octopus sinensis]